MLKEVQLLIILDFIIKLLKLKDSLIGIIYNSILIINDRLTKWVYLEPFKEATSVEEFVYTFLKTIFIRHEILKKIILNRNKLFISQFQQSLTDLIETKYKLLTSYYL